MKWIFLVLLVGLSCNTHRMPKEYRKMERRKQVNERRLQKERFLDSLDRDTLFFRWYNLEDSSMLGFPKIIVDTIKIDSLKLKTN